MINEDSLRARKAAMLPDLDERQRRLFAAAEAKAAGRRDRRGRACYAHRREHDWRGPKDLEALETLPPGRIRRPEGGRQSLANTDSQLLDYLNALVEPDMRGDPMAPLRVWPPN